MSDELRKLFIATKDRIYVGKVDFHRNLAKRVDVPHNEVIGGGDFTYDKDNNTMILEGESTEFGRVDYRTLDELTRAGEVYQTARHKIRVRKIVWG